MATSSVGIGIGIGIVGGGFMGRTWARCAALADGAWPSAVFGGRRAAGLAADFAIPEEPTMAALLVRPDVQAVVIASPPNAHLEQTVAAAEAGKHVLVEKPMARSAPDARRMVQACEQAGVTLAVVSQHRFRDAQLRAKQLLGDGVLGELRMVRLSGINVWWDFAKTEDAWKIAPDQMNVFHDWGAHACDVLRFQIGAEPIRVFAQATSYSGPPPDQSTMAIYTFGNGVLASLWMSYEIPSPRFDSAIKLVLTGSRAILEVDSYSGVRIGQDGEWRDDLRQASFDPHLESDPVRLTAYQRQFADFLDACVTGRPARVTGWDGVMGMQMLDATTLSARSGRAVEL